MEVCHVCAAYICPDCEAEHGTCGDARCEQREAGQLSLFGKADGLLRRPG